MRREYERLRVESVVLYPRALAARDAASFDELHAKLDREGLPWASTFDPGRLTLSTVERIDASYVTLAAPLGVYARRAAEFREEARRRDGRGSAADLGWKLLANTTYGVLGSPTLRTCNFLAANVVTATARAAAFVAATSLNAVQVNTDGLVFRADQVPAFSFDACLRRAADYPLRRADDGEGVRFLDPDAIPFDDAGFTAWYRDHARRFFRTTDRAFQELVAIHDLDHKGPRGGGPPTFDAAAVDGVSNVALLTRDGGSSWTVDRFAARSVGREGREALRDWIIATYSEDRLVEPPPACTDTILLRSKEAHRQARAALKAGMSKALVPLGFERRRTTGYKALKASAFVFATPEQRQTIVRQIRRYEAKTGCGLELLALRRGYAERGGGSLAAVAVEVYAAIREGSADLHKRLNLGRRNDAMTEAADELREDLERRREGGRRELRTMMDAGLATPEERLTGHVLRRRRRRKGGRG